MPFGCSSKTALTFTAMGLALGGQAWTQTQDAVNTPGYHWVGVWGASPSDPTTTQNTPSISNATVRQIVHLGLGTPESELRIRLSNALGTSPITIGEVQLARWAGRAGKPTPELIAGTNRQATFNSGSKSVTIPAGGEVVSDPTYFPAAVGSDMAVSMYVPATSVRSTIHALGNTVVYAVAGDQTGSVALTEPYTSSMRPYLSGVEVAAPETTAAIVTLGDSITDGAYTTPDGNTRWPDDLELRLQKQYGSTIGVVNAGISGNCLLTNLGYGQNAVERFNRDVVTVPGARYLVLLEGVNDIGNDGAITAAEIIAADRGLIARAHDAGMYVYGGTLTPFNGYSSYYSAAHEQIRESVNAFIRSSGAFDGVIDFDAAIRDPKNPTYMLAAYTADHLHPNNAGYQAMANAVNLGLFNPETH